MIVINQTINEQSAMSVICRSPGTTTTMLYIRMPHSEAQADRHLLLQRRRMSVSRSIARCKLTLLKKQ